MTFTHGASSSCNCASPHRTLSVTLSHLTPKDPKISWASYYMLRDAQDAMSKRRWTKPWQDPWGLWRVSPLDCPKCLGYVATPYEDIAWREYRRLMAHPNLIWC